MTKEAFSSSKGCGWFTAPVHRAQAGLQWHVCEDLCIPLNYRCDVTQQGLHLLYCTGEGKKRLKHREAVLGQNETSNIQLEQCFWDSAGMWIKGWQYSHILYSWRVRSISSFEEEGVFITTGTSSEENFCHTVSVLCGFSVNLNLINTVCAPLPWYMPQFHKY